MQIEYIYRCLRCGKEVTIIIADSSFVITRLSTKIFDGLTGSESFCHYCDEEKGQVGRLELTGMNLKK